MFLKIPAFDEQVFSDHYENKNARDTYRVFLSYYHTIAELTIVVEENCNYFSFRDVGKAVCVTPQITQLHLEDFGMSYTVRLSDGRKPVIAAWIMTHPHSDHFHCFVPFIDKYKAQVEIEKFLLNFPDPDDIIHFPELDCGDSRFEYDTTPHTNILMMYERIHALSVQEMACI